MAVLVPLSRREVDMVMVMDVSIFGGLGNKWAGEVRLRSTLFFKAVLWLRKLGSENLKSENKNKF